MKMFHISLLLYVILESTRHQVDISYMHNFVGGPGQRPRNKLGLWLLYNLYGFFFFGVIHSALEVTSVLL